jgi:RNA polymerase sigma factor FliA
MTATMLEPKPKAKAARDAADAELWRDYEAAPTVETRNRLVERYLPLVAYHARRLHEKLTVRVDLDDLISVGVLGLMDAIKRFDAARGVKFTSFCALPILGAMLDELRSLDWTSRIARRKRKKIEIARRAVEIKLGRPAKADELAAEMGLELPEFERQSASCENHAIGSLFHQMHEHEDSGKRFYLIDFQADPRAIDPAERLQRRDAFRVALKGLTECERKIMILYYHENLSMKEIGRAIDLSESRVSQMHAVVLDFARERLAHRRAEFLG